MTDLRLTDLITIILWLGLVTIGAFFVVVAIVLWPQIIQFTRAFRSRHFRPGAWSEFVNRYADDMSSGAAWDGGDEAAFDVAATTAITQQQSIAIEQNDRNALLLQAKAEALAALVEAGAITETKGLQIVFGVRPSSTNPRYLAAREALHVELDRRRGAPTPIAGRPTSAQFPTP